MSVALYLLNDISNGVCHSWRLEVSCNEKLRHHDPCTRLLSSGLRPRPPPRRVSSTVYSFVSFSPLPASVRPSAARLGSSRIRVVC